MIHLINNYSQSIDGIQMLCTRFFYFFPESKFPGDHKRKERFINNLGTKIGFI